MRVARCGFLSRARRIGVMACTVSGRSGPKSSFYGTRPRRRIRMARLRTIRVLRPIYGHSSRGAIT